MSLVAWFGFSVVAIVGFGIAIRQKMRRDAITQHGAWVGSALLAELPRPGAAHIRFLIVRGAAAFQHAEAFKFQGYRCRILSYDRIDDSSPVLRRFLGVTCALDDGG